MTDTTDDLAHLDARIDLIREQRDAMERIAAERAVASDRNLARWTSATDALHKATADLNATREKLTTAEAHCNSFQHERDMAIANRDGLLVERDAVAAERDRLRSELTSMTIMRDKAHAHLAAISASLGVESVSILATIERVRDDIKRKDREWSAMRDERDALRAEVDKLRARPVVTEERLAEATAMGPVAVKQVMANLGAVTLPAQDRGKDLATALGGIYSADHIRVVLASLGAPATTPSKPADVFAGVSIDELVRISADAYVTAVDAPGRAGITAVLDTIRVKLVAPVDPFDVARDYHDHGDAPVSHWSTILGDGKQSRRAVRAMRATLVAKGIPVTPEAGK